MVQPVDGAPFSVNKKVFEAAFSVMLCGCEAWFNVPLKSTETLSKAGVKKKIALLGVWNATHNFAVLLNVSIIQMILHSFYICSIIFLPWSISIKRHCDHQKVCLLLTAYFSQKKQTSNAFFSLIPP